MMIENTFIISKRNIIILLIAAAVMFITGVLLTIFIFKPLLLNITQNSSIRLDTFFMINFSILTGCIFSLPVVMIPFSQLINRSPQTIKGIRILIFILIWAAAAVMCPPDIIFQSIISIPLVVIAFILLSLRHKVYKLITGIAANR